VSTEAAYLFDPLGQQSGGEHDRVSDGENDEVAVGGDVAKRHSGDVTREQVETWRSGL